MAYSALGEHFAHHGASMQIVAADGGGSGSRFLWISDFLPDALAAHMAPLIEDGCAAFRRATAEAAGRVAPLGSTSPTLS